LQPERLLVSKYGKNALAAGAAPRAPLGELAVLPQTPSWILGRKDGVKKRRGRNVRKEGKGRRDEKEGRGIAGKEEEGTLLISFAPQPLNPGDATAKKPHLTVAQSSQKQANLQVTLRKASADGGDPSPLVGWQRYQPVSLR